MRRAAVILTIFALAACSSGVRQFAASPEGDIDFLTEDSARRFTAGADIRRQAGYFDLGLDGLSFVRVDGNPAVKVVTPSEGGVVGLLTNQPLLATPFAGWQWRLTSAIDEAGWMSMRQYGETDHPVRILIGFRLSGSGSTLKPTFSGDELPPHDRAITIVWSTLSSPAGRFDRKGPYGRVTLRQGASGFGEWTEENVDLSRLYQDIWPGDPISQVAIAFIAIASRKSGLVTEGVIDGLRVYR